MKKVFLLGGYDLEMIEIKNILDNQDIFYIDKKLSWGANLSSYEDELNKYQNDYIIYGIELKEDITPPKNYIQIDHHNKNSFKKSSIEQTANILNINLNRYQKLVSINDSRYIKGLEEFGATKEEIKSIREKDRQYQGISQKDEDLAQISIEKSNSNIIYSQTNHFSAISDRAYFLYKDYIVYDDLKVVFYFYKVETVLSFLHLKNIENKYIYYGGGEYGFVGIEEKALKKEKILFLVKEFSSYER